MKNLKKYAALFLTLALLLASVSALAAFIEPINAESLRGKTVHATVTDYRPEDKTFRLTVYEPDRFPVETVRGLALGDTLLLGDELCTVSALGKAENDYLTKLEDGREIYFTPAADDENVFLARDMENDFLYMHQCGSLRLPVSTALVYEDLTDPDASEPAAYTDLDAILGVLKDKETNSIGFDYYATTVTFSDKLEIERIHQVFDVAQ